MLLPWVLLAQAVVGGADTILNHEIVARLPHRPESRREIALHAVRESIYATLFIGLALFAWQGGAAWIIAAVLAAEVVVTGTDELIENRTRKLPDNERVMHVFLTLNLGLIIALLVPTLRAWSAEPTGWTRVDHGLLGWLLVALGLASAGWSLRDALAWVRLGRQNRRTAPRSPP